MNYEKKGFGLGRKMIVFKCLKCGADMSVPDSLAGEYEKCPACGAMAAVPDLQNAMPPQPAGASAPTQAEQTIIHLLRNIRSEVSWISIWYKVASVIIVTWLVICVICFFMFRGH